MMHRLASSFRDPAGFVFEKGGTIYRHIDASYQEEYQFLEKSGLRQELTEAGLLIRHEEEGQPASFSAGAWKVLRPERIPFISYSYEWCFGQLREAAKLVLKIHEAALKKGMVLKDASAANVQWIGSRPVWIDTLSFEIYSEKNPWIAYQQFCRHFVAPLALAAYKDVRLLQALSLFPDGIPLDFAARLLPASTWLNPHLLFHIHGNARTGVLSAGFGKEERGGCAIGREGLLRIVGHLRETVERLSWKPGKTAWSRYSPEEHYGKEGMEEKEKIVSGYLGKISPKTVWDLGANHGRFSELAGSFAKYVVAFEQDPAVVQTCWEALRQKKSETILPLWTDIAQPAPGRGWENRERLSLQEGGPADLVLALGLVHHLALGTGVPFERIAGFFAALGRHLIIEFVPPDDPKARQLAERKEKIFRSWKYGRETFEAGFQPFFRILERRPVGKTGRILYHMEASASFAPHA